MSDYLDQIIKNRSPKPSSTPNIAKHSDGEAFTVADGVVFGVRFRTKTGDILGMPYSHMLPVYLKANILTVISGGMIIALEGENLEALLDGLMSHMLSDIQEGGQTGDTIIKTLSISNQYN